MNFSIEEDQVGELCIAIKNKCRLNLVEISLEVGKNFICKFFLKA